MPNDCHSEEVPILLVRQKHQCFLQGKSSKILRHDPECARNETQDEKNKLTGYATKRKGKGFLTRLLEWLFNIEITGYAVLDQNETNTTEIIIEEEVEELELEYYTEGPYAVEKNISDNKKQITIKIPVKPRLIMVVLLLLMVVMIFSSFL